MQIPAQVSATGLELTAEQQAAIAEAVSGLERFFSRLVACHVAVTVPNRRMDGDPVAWNCRLALTVPGEVLTVTRRAKPSFAEAVDDAFDAARRQLQDYAREVRGEVKGRAEEPHGRISQLFSYEGYGFITAEDGHEVYFHRNSVPDAAFGRLAIGAEVRFVETEGEKGPQASTVVAIGHAGSEAVG